MLNEREDKAHLTLMMTARCEEDSEFHNKNKVYPGRVCATSSCAVTVVIYSVFFYIIVKMLKSPK